MVLSSVFIISGFVAVLGLSGLLMLGTPGK